MSDPTISTTTAGTTVRPAKYGGRKQATPIVGGNKTRIPIFGGKKTGPPKSKKRKM